MLTENDNFIYDLADFFKIFGDSTRLRIISTLLDKELSVKEIAEKLNASHSSISHQLKNLRQNRVVKYRKQGKYSLYSLDDDHVRSILTQGIEHLSHSIK